MSNIINTILYDVARVNFALKVLKKYFAFKSHYDNYLILYQFQAIQSKFGLQ